MIVVVGWDFGNIFSNTFGIVEVDESLEEETISKEDISKYDGILKEEIRS